MGVPAIGSGPAAKTLYTLTATDTPTGTGALTSGTSPGFTVVPSGTACQIVLSGMPAVGATTTLAANSGTLNLTAEALDSTGGSGATQSAVTVHLSVYDSHFNALNSNDYSPNTISIGSGNTNSSPASFFINRAGGPYTIVAIATDNDGTNNVPLLSWQTTSSPTSGTGASGPITMVTPGTTVQEVAFTQNVGAGYGVGQIPPNIGVGPVASGGNQTVLPTLQVTCYDGFGTANNSNGNVCTTFTGAVSLTLSPPGGSSGVLQFPNPSGSGTVTGTLGSNTISTNASNGVATFSNVVVVNGGAPNVPAGYGYTLFGGANSQTTNNLTLNVLASGQPASLYFQNPFASPQTGDDATFLVDSNGNTPVVGVKDVNGTVLTTPGTFATGITFTPFDIGSGLGTPYEFGSALNDNNIDFTTSAGNPSTMPVTGANGVALFDYATVGDFEAYAPEVGATLGLRGAVTTPATYSLNNGRSNVFDLWPGLAEYISTLLGELNSQVVVPQVANGASIAAANVLTPVGPPSTTQAVGTSGIVSFQVLDDEGDAPASFSGTATAELVPQSGKVFYCVPTNSSVVAVGDPIISYDNYPYGAGVVLAKLGGGILVAATGPGTFVSGNGSLDTTLPGYYGSSLFAQGQTIPATTVGLTLTGSTAGFNVNDVIVNDNGTQVLILDVNATAQTLAGVVTPLGTQVTIPLTSTANFNVGDTIVEGGGAKATVFQVNTNTSLVAGVVPGTAVTLTVTSTTGIALGDQLTETGGATGFVSSLGATTLTAQVTGGVWPTASSFTDAQNGGLGSVAYTGGSTTTVASWPTAGSVLDQASDATGTFTTASSAQSLTWPAASGIFDLTTSSAAASYTGGVSGTPVLGHLIGTTTVNVIAGVAVFPNLAVTGQSIPGGGPWMSSLGCLFHIPTGSGLEGDTAQSNGFFVK